MGVTAAIRAAGLAIATIKSQSMGGACRNWRLRIKKVPVAADSAFERSSLAPGKLKN